MMIYKGKCKVAHLRMEPYTSEGPLWPTDLERTLAESAIRDLVAMNH